MDSDVSIEIARRLADLLRENARLQAEFTRWVRSCDRPFFIEKSRRAGLRI